LGLKKNKKGQEKYDRAHTRKWTMFGRFKAKYNIMYMLHENL